jgi:hypothetical protein
MKEVVSLVKKMINLFFMFRILHLPYFGVMGFLHRIQRIYLVNVNSTMLDIDDKGNYFTKIIEKLIK